LKGRAVKIKFSEVVNVEVDGEVDVDCNGVLCEFSDKLKALEAANELPNYNRLILPLVDFATKLMARIPKQAIARCSDEQRREVALRLKTELERWDGIWIAAE